MIDNDLKLFDRKIHAKASLNFPCLALSLNFRFIDLYKEILFKTLP